MANWRDRTPEDFRPRAKSKPMELSSPASISRKTWLLVALPVLSFLVGAAMGGYLLYRQSVATDQTASLIEQINKLQADNAELSDSLQKSDAKAQKAAADLATANKQLAAANNDLSAAETAAAKLQDSLAAFQRFAQAVNTKCTNLVTSNDTAKATCKAFTDSYAKLPN